MVPAEPTRIQAARPVQAADWVADVLADLDRRLAALAPSARQKLLRRQHDEWTEAAIRRQARVVYFEDMDDHLRIIAGITARLREVSHG